MCGDYICSNDKGTLVAFSIKGQWMLNVICGKVSFKNLCCSKCRWWDQRETVLDQSLLRTEGETEAIELPYNSSRTVYLWQPWRPSQVCGPAPGGLERIQAKLVSLQGQAWRGLRRWNAAGSWGQWVPFWDNLADCDHHSGRQRKTPGSAASLLEKWCWQIEGGIERVSWIVTAVTASFWLLPMCYKLCYMLSICGCSRWS